MKLLRTDNNRFTFAISQTDRQLLFQVVRLYPLVPPSHHHLSKNEEGPAHDENQRLLEEALADQRRANRKQVEAMLNEPERFRATADTLQFNLTRAQMEWLLQVMNDIRVGSWLALGKPDELDIPEINEGNAAYMLAMAAASHFEGAILRALGIEEPLSPVE